MPDSPEMTALFQPAGSVRLARFATSQPPNSIVPRRVVQVEWRVYPGCPRHGLGMEYDRHLLDAHTLLNAIEVEFVTASGHTQALVTLTARRVRPIGPKDILAVRQFDAA
jgi:hypothetical protein